MRARDTLAALVRRTRLLPAVMACVGLLLACKLWVLVAAGGAPDALATAGRAVLPVARAAAEEPHKAAPVPAAPVPAVQAPAAQAPAAQAPAAQAPAARPAALAVAGPAQPPPSPAEPPMPAMSDAERSLLQDLRGRRSALDAREGGMQQREAVLAAAEKRLAARVDELSALQARLEVLERGRRDRDEANWRGLVKTYEAMRPRDAATIFNDLDGPVLMQVLDRMKEAKTAPVLAAMQPERARAATADLARWRSRTTAEPQP